MSETDPYPPTELLPSARATQPSTAAAPVFVDASGRRRRLAHRVAIAALVAVGGYTLMVIWSLLGGPVPPDTLTPFSAPHAAASSAASAKPSAEANATARAISSPPRTTPTASSAVHSAAPAPSAARSPAPSASPAASSARRPTAAPGRPTATATGHGR